MKQTLLLLILCLPVYPLFAQLADDSWFLVGSGNQDAVVNGNVDRIDKVITDGENIYVRGISIGEIIRLKDQDIPTNYYSNIILSVTASGKINWHLASKRVQNNGMALDLDKNLIIAGGANGIDSRIIKINASGDTILDKTINSNLFLLSPSSVAVDSNNDIIIYGYYLQGDRPTVFEDTVINNLYSEYQSPFVAKYDTEGNFKWVNFGSGGDSYIVSDVITDIDDNILTLAQFRAESSPLQLGHDSFKTDIWQDAVLAKYDTKGNYLWGKNFKGNDETWGNKLAVDGEGNIYATGSFQEALVVSNESVLSKGGYDIYLTKHTPAGELSWIQSAGGKYDDTGRGLFVDSSGQLFLSGSYQYNILFKAKNDEQIAVETWSAQAGYIATFDLDGFAVHVDAMKGRRSTIYALENHENNIIFGGNFYHETSLRDGILPAIDQSKSNFFIGYHKKHSTVTSIPVLADLDDEVGIYPNPTTSTVKITFQNHLAKSKTIWLYDSKGQLIDKVVTSQNEYDFILNNYAPGMYYMKIAIANSVFTKKVIKVN